MTTLFGTGQSTVDTFQSLYKLTISIEFVSCMDLQLNSLLFLETGLKTGKQLCISWASEWEFFLEKGKTSKVAFSLFANHNWNPITIMWKSNSGRIYELHDTDIDCDDIEFWFENLDVALIHKQMFPGDQLPFKVKNLTYQLVVARISMDCTFELTLKEIHVADAGKIIESIDSYFANFNERSEKRKRKPGLIHSYHPKADGNKIIYDIDLGSAGPAIFKNLLPYLSSLNYFTRVEIG